MRHLVDTLLNFKFRKGHRPLQPHEISKTASLDAMVSNSRTGYYVLKTEDRGYHLVSVTGPYGDILAFLDRSLYVFFQEAPQLYSRG
jgi:hypothetical protein